MFSYERGTPVSYATMNGSEVKGLGFEDWGAGFIFIKREAECPHVSDTWFVVGIHDSKFARVAPEVYVDTPVQAAIQGYLAHKKILPPRTLQ